MLQLNFYFFSFHHTFFARVRLSRNNGQDPQVLNKVHRQNPKGRKLESDAELN